MGLHAFVSYVHDDAEPVARLCAELQAGGVKLWLDRHDLFPGVRWQDAIRSAIESGTFFLACFSLNATRRSRTYMNEELLIAVDELRIRSRDRAWFLPVIFSACDIPAIPIGAGETLRSIQHVDLEKDWARGVQNLLRVLKPAGMSDEDRLLAAANGRMVAWIENLASSESDTVSAAERELSQYGASAVPALARALEHRNGTVQGRAARLLGKLGPAAANAVPALLTKLEVAASSDVIIALGQIADSHAVPALMGVFADHRNPSQDYVAMTALLRIGAPGVQALSEMFQSSDGVRRVRAAAALLFVPAFGRFHDLEQQTEIVRRYGPAATILIDAIRIASESGDTAIAEEGTRALHTVHVLDSEMARPPLLAALERSEPRIRAAALGVFLGLKVRHPTVIAAIRSLENDPDPDVRRRANGTLREITGRWQPGPMGGYRIVDGE